MTSSSYAQVLTETATTKRSPGEVAGVVGAMVQNLASLACSELFPVDASLVDRVPQLAQYAVIWEVYTEIADVVVGDRLVLNGSEYPIRVMEKWPWRGSEAYYLRLVVEEVKT